MDNAYHQIAMCCMNKYVGITTSDGQSHDGFIAHVDQDYITLAIPHPKWSEWPQMRLRTDNSGNSDSIRVFPRAVVLFVDAYHSLL